MKIKLIGSFKNVKRDIQSRIYYWLYRVSYYTAWILAIIVYFFILIYRGIKWWFK